MRTAFSIGDDEPPEAPGINGTEFYLTLSGVERRRKAAPTRSEACAKLNEYKLMVAKAKPGLPKLNALEVGAGVAATFVREGFFSKGEIADEWRDLAISNGIIDDVGEDIVQEILARALEKCNVFRDDDLARVNSELDARAVVQNTVGVRPALNTVCLSDVTSQPVEWLWPGRIAAGKLTLIAGDPGLGKSQAALDIAARITTGEAWPDGGRPAPIGSVIILSAEDGVADTLRPRSEAAGGDVSRIHVVTAVARKEGGQRMFSLQADIASLSAKVREFNDVRLVII